VIRKSTLTYNCNFPNLSFAHTDSSYIDHHYSNWRHFNIFFNQCYHCLLYHLICVCFKFQMNFYGLFLTCFVVLKKIKNLSCYYYLDLLFLFCFWVWCLFCCLNIINIDHQHFNEHLFILKNLQAFWCYEHHLR
jgi:hypothetical protein